jgi:hypothetical protein
MSDPRTLDCSNGSGGVVPARHRRFCTSEPAARTAREIPTVAALIRLAERFETLAAKRSGLPDEDGRA